MRSGGDRLDLVVWDRGLAQSRNEAQGLILAGRVRVGGQVVDKPGRRVPPGADISVEHPPHRYVSRGGVKLERALDRFGIDVTGLVCLDAGASTGGFTDCLLTHGAARVYAVDVGYGLLAWSLRQDPRVIPVERTNARHLDRERLAAAIEAAGREVIWPTLATCDLSFISLLKVVPAVRTLLDSPWQMVVLVKPQFEAGREKVGTRGVVRDPAVHVEVLERVGAGLGELGTLAGLTWSPVRGPEGNVEYLLWLVERGHTPAVPAAPRWTGAEIRSLVEEALGTVHRT